MRGAGWGRGAVGVGRAYVLWKVLEDVNGWIGCRQEQSSRVAAIRIAGSAKRKCQATNSDMMRTTSNYTSQSHRRTKTRFSKNPPPKGNNRCGAFHQPLYVLSSKRKST